MHRRFSILLLLVTFFALVPFRSPAPLIFVPGEGWFYQTSGQALKWQRNRAKDQLDVAEQAFKDKDYTTALHAAHRTVSVWPLSDYAPRAQYLIGRTLEAMNKDQAAFNAYQVVIEKYPKSAEYNEVLWRQYGIGNRFLAGEFFKIWNLIPLYRSMDETAKMYEKIVNNGPYSDVAPHAQLRIGAAGEKGHDYAEAVKAYETAADRYHDQPTIAADALYREGVAWQKQAATAEYDQSAAGQAIASYTDFVTLYPDDARVSKAQQAIVQLKAEQVRGNYKIALFYEHNKTLNAEQRARGAIVYYNEVLQLDPNSRYASAARHRIELLKPQIKTPTS